MGKYKLRLNLNTGGTVTTNAIDLPAKVVSAEFVKLGYSGNLIASPTASTHRGLPLYLKFGSAPTSISDCDAMLDASDGATIQGITSFSGQEIVYVWTTDGAGTMATPNVIYNGQTFSTSAGKYNTYIYSHPLVIELTTNGDITMQTYCQLI